jgi:predicted RNA polymerase sigma factor
MRLHLARDDARFAPDGSLALLEQQDRSRWDRARIRDAVALLDRAAAMRRPGRYQLEAAIAALHAEAPSFDATDWPAIVRLYDALLGFVASPVIALNRAIALRHVAGPELALRDAEALGDALERYHIYHATRGVLLRALGRDAEARAANERALALTDNPAERQLLRQRLGNA